MLPVAGLLWMYFPSCTNVEIRHVLTATAKDLGPTGCEEEYGYGMVQAKNAYDLLNEGNCGGNIGPTDPKGGCEELHEAAPGPSTGDTGTVEVSVTTDRYYQETSWDIVSGSDSNTLMSGGNYAAQKTYTKSEDLLACGEEYTFTIKDSYGDGICCNYGRGRYTVKVDNEVVAEGGDFTSEEATTFSIGTNTLGTSPKSSVTSSTSPVTSSSLTPTTSPVTLPTDSSCILCDDVESNSMIQKGKDCTTLNKLHKKCNKNPNWRQNKFCQLSCYDAGVGYDGDVCCNGATN